MKVGTGLVAPAPALSAIVQGPVGRWSQFGGAAWPCRCLGPVARLEGEKAAVADVIRRGGLIRWTWLR
jgi:hypothetical protein